MLMVCAGLILIPGLQIGAAATPEESIVKVPVGIPADLWSYFIPRDNPLTQAKVELGRRLFFDRRLSSDGSVSCSSCHDPAKAFTDGRTTAEGIGGRRGVRNSPTILNAMFNSTQFWDGRADSLEAQAKLPLINADEMGNASHDAVVKRLAGIPEYSAEFQSVFVDAITVNNLAKAIAAYERTLVSANSPFDRFQEGDRRAISEAAQRGFNLFRGKARCSICHTINQSFPFFTDGNYRNTGVASNFSGFAELSQRATSVVTAASFNGMAALEQHQGKAELGRFMVSRDSLDIGAFRTPSLRNVELTAPYFHDGSAATLADVVRYYNKGGNENSNRDWELQSLNLSAQEQLDLIEFLKSLTSDDARKSVAVANEKKGFVKAPL